MKQRGIFVSLLILFISNVYAQQIGVSEAMSRAKAFLQTNSSRRAPSKSTQSSSQEISLAYTAQSITDDKVCYYIFNKGNNNGFIIVGADEAAQDIIGYSDSGTFDYATAPDNFKWWLSQYQQQITSAIDYAEQCPQVVSAAKAKRSRISRASANSQRHDINPLIQTKWSQYEPFSDAVNADFQSQTNVTNQSFVTGCVPTALAQVMYYHKYPTKGTGNASGPTMSYTINKQSYSFTPSADFASTTYDWDNMLAKYTKNRYTEAQGKAVATLMYHAGVAINTKYDIYGSGASQSVVPKALTTYFGYDKGMRDEYRCYYSDSDWENLVYNELANGRPVIYGGRTDNGAGHTFICDGYRTSDDLYSFNWGWGDYCDGWYALTGEYALEPNGSGISRAVMMAAYTVDQEIITGVKPDEGGIESPQLINYNGTISLMNGSSTTMSYTHKHGTAKVLTLKEHALNRSRTLTTFTLGVKAKDTTTGRVYYFTDNETSKLESNYMTNFTKTFNVNELQYNGTYEIKMVARNRNSKTDNDWHEVGVKTNIAIPTVTIKGAIDPDKNDVTVSISDDVVQETRSLQISHTSAYKGNITYISSDESVAIVDNYGIVTGISIGKATITAIAAGDTYFNRSAQTFNVKVTQFTKANPEVTISCTELHTDDTADITINEEYNGTPRYKSDNKSVATVSSNGTITAISKGTANISVTIPETDIYNATSTTFTVNVTEDDVYLVEQPYFTNDNNPWEGDCKLHVKIKNGSSSSKAVNVYCKVCEISGNNEYEVFTPKMSWSSLSASCTMPSTMNIGYVTLTEGAQHRIYFYSDSKCTKPYNIDHIDFTYRSTLNYDYTIASDGIGTLILPFNADIPTVSNDGNDITWHAYECTNFDGSTVVLSEVTSLKRNTPYIIYGTAATCTFTGPNAVDSYPILFGDGVLKGTMLCDTYQLTANDYVLQEKNSGVAFYQNTSAWYAAPYSAFIQDPSSSISYAAIPGYSEGSKISTNLTDAPVTSFQHKSPGIYSLNGVRNHQMQPGINIIVDENGQAHKVLLKK